jgi:hypothetical protein
MENRAGAVVQVRYSAVFFDNAKRQAAFLTLHRMRRATTVKFKEILLLPCRTSVELNHHKGINSRVGVVVEARCFLHHFEPAKKRAVSRT